MSSGALLLRQLQARNRDQAARVRADQRRINPDTTRAAIDEVNLTDMTANQSAGSGTVDNEKALESRQADGDMDNGDKSTSIEVCLGPDCSGGGGGAALLEIESLVKSGGEQGTDAANKSNICVVSGGCRDYCTMGPNVHIHSESVAAKNCHFTKVNCPAECRRVVRAATGEMGTCGGDDGNADNIAKILQLREDRRRWRVLREQAAKERRLRMRERDKKSEG